MAHEVITVSNDGSVGSEMFGFKGKSCLKAAAEIAKELERLGVVTEVGVISMKEDANFVVETQQLAMEVEGGCL